MARLIIFLLVIVAIAIITIFVSTMVQSAVAPGQSFVRDTNKGALMAPTGLQKVAYAALLILLFGTATGILGGG